ncbi:dihydrofolate reductase family protein [Actinomyces bowdenii]|uniref:Dihydrofolate reductase family protein n=1 Tax=Actinomyces bowdenii TaxID=131109 RepID=A0A853EKR7_9ACTO|nr:dihydrofolate reductase family protein [Actinomyces bowdenii]NYS69923.1 dihydrofolate reductase family protein [Actinomyces bowdenii]
MTRQLISTLFYSVDGVASDPFRFQHDSFDADLAGLMTEAIGRIDDVVLGRVTYGEWAGYWPGHTGEDAGFADFINGVRKHVASRTLSPKELTWSGASLIEGDLLEHVRALKAAEGGDIAVQGSLSVVRQLVEAGLIDALTLIIHPAIAGSGRSLFEGSPATRLRLINASSTQKGNVVAVYGPYRD